MSIKNIDTNNIEFEKDGNGGYTGFNTATGLYCHIFPAMLRNKAITEIIEII